MSCGCEGRCEGLLEAGEFAFTDSMEVTTGDVCTGKEPLASMMVLEFSTE